MPHRSLLSLTLLTCLIGCDDEAVNEPRDAAPDVAVDAGFTQAETKPDDAHPAAIDAIENDTPTYGVDAPLDEFSWSVDPMTVQLRRGTCRELLVQVKRRPDFKDAVTLGVGDGPLRVGFSTTHVEPGASVGTIILATPNNAPAVANKPMIVAASGKATYLRITLNVTVLDTEPASDGGVVETSADAGIWNNDTCSQTLEGLSKTTN